MTVAAAQVKKKKPARRVVVTAVAIGTVVAVVATFFAVLGINNAGRFEQSIDAECAPLAVLAFRGSGEQNLTPGVDSNAGEPYRYGDTELVTNGWEGVTLTGLFDALSTTTYEGFRADQIPVIPIGPAGTTEPYGYDAIAAVLEASSIDSALSFSSSRLLYSASRGAEAATYLIRDYLRASEGCPVLPKFIVVGYSQGAMAARHTAELNPESVIGVVKIGDPYQKPNAPGVRAEGSDGVGIIRWKADLFQQEQLDTYYNAPDLRSAICHAGDPICEFTPLEGLVKLATGSYGDHLDYYSDGYPDEAEVDALEIAKLAYERWMLARAAEDAGQSVSFAEAGAAADDAELRTLSLSFVGTPTLFSAFSPDHLGREMRYEFDLDGDGTFETQSPDGTVWVTFDEAGERTIGVRVTDPDGTVTETTRTVAPTPESEGDIVFTAQGELLDPTAPTADQPVSAAPAPTPSPAPAPQPPASTTPPRPAPTPSPTSSPEAPIVSPSPTPTPTPSPSPGDPGGENPPEEPAPEPMASLEGSPTPGSDMVVTGGGFLPRTDVRVLIADLSIDTTVVSDDDGGVFVPFGVPVTAAPGAYEVIVQYVTGTSAAGALVLSLEVPAEEEPPGPAFVITPDTLTPGSEAAVDVSGLVPGTTVIVRGDVLAFFAEGVAGEDGFARIDIVIVDGARPGDYEIEVELGMPGAEVSQVVSFTLTVEALTE